MKRLPLFPLIVPMIAAAAIQDPVKTDVGQFWDSLAPLTCLFNLLISAIVERLGPGIDERVARNHELQSEFDQFDL